jgi:hypothetical protein
MSRTIVSKHAHPSGEADLSKEDLGQRPNPEQSRRAFYDDYRKAVKEFRAGKPERFIAYQSDPRINPGREKATPSKGPESPQTAVDIINAERINLATDTKVSVISLMASIRSLTMTLSTFFK